MTKQVLCSHTHTQIFISESRIRVIFILLPTLHVWFDYIFDFAKETYCLLSSLLNLAQVMESVLGKIISCRNNEAIGMSLLFFFSLIKWVWIHPVVWKDHMLKFPWKVPWGMRCLFLDLFGNASLSSQIWSMDKKLYQMWSNFTQGSRNCPHVTHCRQQEIQKRKDRKWFKLVI